MIIFNLVTRKKQKRARSLMFKRLQISDRAIIFVHYFVIIFEVYYLKVISVYNLKHDVANNKRNDLFYEKFLKSPVLTKSEKNAKMYGDYNLYSSSVQLKLSNYSH